MKTYMSPEAVSGTPLIGGHRAKQQRATFNRPLVGGMRVPMYDIYS